MCTEMKLDFLSTISLSDINVSLPDGDKGGREEDPKQAEEEGGCRETLLQIRKRSRKRRSFMQTDYTSTVSYPEPDQESKQDLVYSRLHKKPFNQASDAQMLSLDPEPSAQTQNPSPTVSSLTHSEGEPAQLESKPILSKSCSCGTGTPSGFGSPELNGDSQAPSRTRKQEMEMEPDAMESKSVTDLLKVVPPIITVFRCRVEPDGKESADQQGDGDEEEMGEGGMEGDKKEITGSGPFNSHLFIIEVSDMEDKGEERLDERADEMCSSPRLICAERQSDINTLPSCVDVNEEGSNSFLEFYPVLKELNSNRDEHMLHGMCDMSDSPSYSPPPPPPSSPRPPTPVFHKSQSECVEGEETDNGNTGVSNKMSSTNPEEIPHSEQNQTNKAQLEGLTGCNVEEANGVVSSVTTSDEITDSTNSDNVFEDEEMSALNSSSSDKKDNWTLATDYSNRAHSAKEGKGELQMSIRSLTNTEIAPRIHSINCDYTRAINSITAKLGAATSVASSAFTSGARLEGEVVLDNATYSNQNVEKTTLAVARFEAKDSLASPTLTKATHNHPKQPTFQICSPNLMGRLSASTLRGKIQNLPLYLSRSQETLNQVGVFTAAQNPPEHNRNDVEITIKVTDVDDVTQTVDDEMDLAAESVESDDSDTTVTGSEVDGEFTKCSDSEMKEVISPFPVDTEPKPLQNQPLSARSVTNTPGPITEPPRSIVNCIQRDKPGLRTDTPGPVIDAPQSNMVIDTAEEIPGFKISSQSSYIPPPIVVTTQNLNGPGLPIRNPSQEERWGSSNRPLMGLCRPSEHNSESQKTLSSGCRVFPLCEDPSQTKTAAEVGTAAPLKSEFGCSSVLASGCESVVEGVQVPLDACGCPAAYTNCFSGGVSFDDELTIYEFSCRTQSSAVTQTSVPGRPLVTSPPAPSFLSTSTTLSPSFPHSILSSSTSELSPLLSPLSDTSDCFLSQTHKDTISRLGQQHYPEPPAGFQVLRIDVDQLLLILESSSAGRSVAGHGGRHPRDTCPAHFTENKRMLQIEARRLMSGCQKVVGIGQSPEEMLHSLADSFRTLAELASICLWFSGCDRCDRRNAEAVAGLADVARSFRDFCLAAERASSKRSCQDLSTKLLAKQCTALTASVFCLTQLFRTLTAL